MQGRSVWFLLGELFHRRTAPPGPMTREEESDSDPFRFTELVATASILDFGGWPVEWPPLGECSSSARHRRLDERDALGRTDTH